MRYGRVEGVARELSRLIQGTLLLGQHSDEQAFALFDAAYAGGCNAFDTALVYGAGRAQSLLGRWARERGVRDGIVICDKGCHPERDQPRMAPHHLERDITLSLANLGVERIDLYFLHRDDPSVPVDEIVSALNEQRARGRIAAFGASNWSEARLSEARAYATRQGLASFSASSPGVSLADPVQSWPGCISICVEEQPAALAWYREAEMPLFAWSPLASGFLSGRFRRESEPATPGERRVLEFYASERNWQRLERLRALAEERGVAVAEAALAYVLRLPVDVYTVLGCRDAEEFQGALRALDISLSEAEVRLLEGEAGG